MNAASQARPALNTWLQTVHKHLEFRRTERLTAPRPSRNRERERARREARQLFLEYYRETALQGL